MSSGIGVTTKAEVFLSVDQIVCKMDAADIGSFCSAVADRLDREFADRAEAASCFADGLSERGARFLAEVVTSHFQRQKNGGGA